MPSQDEVNNFQAIIGRLAALAGDTAATIMREIDEADQPEAYAAAVDPHLNASSLITAEWYDSLSDKPFAVAPAPPADPETLRYKAGWAATEDDPAGALQGATERLVFGASRDTVIENAEREEVSFARHAQEDACAFCRLLATRGLVYHSRESAAAASHDFCQCVVVPNRDGDYYLEPDYVDAWRKQYEKALEEVGPAKKENVDAILNHMRRARHAEDPERDNLKQRDYYQQNKDEINRRARKAYANKKTLI